MRGHFAKENYFGIYDLNPDNTLLNDPYEDNTFKPYDYDAVLSAAYSAIDLICANPAVVELTIAYNTKFNMVIAAEKKNIDHTEVVSIWFHLEEGFYNNNVHSMPYATSYGNLNGGECISEYKDRFKSYLNFVSMGR